MRVLSKKEAGQQVALTQHDYEKSRLASIFEGASARTIFNLTSGAFLAGFLKYIGADDKVCGQIAAIPVLAATIQFISPIILERLESKRNIVILFCFLHRLMFLSLLLVPILPVSLNFKLWTVGFIYFFSFLFVSFVMPAVSSWLVNLVPQSIRGKYFAVRESYVVLVSSVLNIVMGRILDIFKESGKQYSGYIVLFSVIFVALVINLGAFIFMKEPLAREKKGLKDKKRLSLIEPLKNLTFRKIIVLFVIWGMGIYIGAPFFGVYMVSGLKFEYTFINLNGMIFSVVYLVAVRFWGKVADRKSWAFTTMASMAILSITHMLWVLIFKDNSLLYVLVILAHILSGIGSAGINISLFNIQFDYVPEEGKTTYIGFNAALSGIVGFCVSMAASFFIGKMETMQIKIIGIVIGNMQTVFFLSGIVIGLASLYIYFALIKRHDKERT